MAVRRRAPRGRRPFRRNGRQSMWIQSTLANLSLVQTTTGLFTGSLIDPADWEREVSQFTKMPLKAGGPRLEGMYLDVVLNLSNEAQYYPIVPELMVYTQSSQFANVVTGSGTFDQTFNNQRTLLYDATTLCKHQTTQVVSDVGVLVQQFHDRWQIKSKCRLAETNINVALLCRTDLTSFVNASAQVAFRAYVTVP